MYPYQQPDLTDIISGDYVPWHKPVIASPSGVSQVWGDLECPELESDLLAHEDESGTLDHAIQSCPYADADERLTALCAEHCTDTASHPGADPVDIESRLRQLCSAGVPECRTCTSSAASSTARTSAY